MTNEQWNRYPEKKPTKAGKYLVCRKSTLFKHTSPYTIDIIWWGKSEYCDLNKKPSKKKYWYVVDFDYGDYEVDNVCAWMPLPDTFTDLPF